MTLTPFDIYRSRAGFVAVADPGERAVLRALGRGSVRADSLVASVQGSLQRDVTGIVASLEARELVRCDTDNGIHLAAQHVGTSMVPVPELRGAVHSYVELAPLKARPALAAVWRALLAGEPSRPMLARQAHAIGASLVGGQPPSDPGTSWLRFVDVLLEQKLVSGAVVSLEQKQVRLTPHPNARIPRGDLHVLVQAAGDGAAGRPVAPPNDDQPVGTGPLLCHIR